MDPEPQDLTEIVVKFRTGAPEAFACYRVTADTLAAMAADWERSKPADRGVNTRENESYPKSYPVYPLHGNERRQFMLRLEDVLYIG